MTQIATLVYCLAIVGFFLLDRDSKTRTSKALWLPVLWLSISASRPVSAWLDMNPISTSDQLLEGSPFDRAVFTGLLIVAIVVLLGRSRRVGTLLWENKPIFFFMLYCGLSILWSDYPDVAFKRWTKALGDLAMVSIVLTDLEPLAAMKRLFARTAFLFMPLSILFIKYYPELGRYYGRWEGKQFYGGVTQDKNMLGVGCLIFGIGSAWRFFQELRSEETPRRYGPMFAHGVVILMALWLLFAADSMTSLACFVLAGVLMGVLGERMLARRRMVVHFMVVAAILLAYSAEFYDIGLVQVVGRDPSLTGRTDIWATVLGLTGNPWLGTGFESFWLGPRLEKIWDVYWFHPNEAHNGYLELFLNLGWIGVGLVAVVMLTGYRRIVAALSSNPDVARLSLACFVVALIYNFTEAGFRVMSPVWISFLLAIIAIRIPALDASALEMPVAENVAA